MCHVLILENAIPNPLIRIIIVTALLGGVDIAVMPVSKHFLHLSCLATVALHHFLFNNLCFTLSHPEGLSPT